MLLQRKGKGERQDAALKAAALHLNLHGKGRAQRAVPLRRKGNGERQDAALKAAALRLNLHGKGRTHPHKTRMGHPKILKQRQDAGLRDTSALICARGEYLLRVSTQGIAVQAKSSLHGT